MNHQKIIEQRKEKQMVDNGNGQHEIAKQAVHIVFNALHSANFAVQIEGEITANQMRAVAGWLMTEAEIIHVTAKNMAAQREAQRHIQVPGTIREDTLKKVN